MFEDHIRNSKLQHLHKCMMRYENMTGESMKSLKRNLYYRNRVISRAELTDEQLDAEILFFTSI